MSFLRPAARQFATHASRTLFTHAAPNALHPTKFRALKPVLLGSAALCSVVLALNFHPTVQLDAELPAAKQIETTADPATGIEFPNTLQVPAKVKLPGHALVGVGVRTVSFLGIKVYSVAFYADLENPNLKVPRNLTPDEKIKHIVNNTSCVIRIVPTRSTSYTHLRDAFMRTLHSRMAVGRKDGTITEEIEQAAASPLRKLKSLFPNSPLAKHTPLDIYLTPPTPGKPRSLVFRDMGAIEDNWVATELVLAYFDGDGPSPPLKKSVTSRLEAFEK
ncbi:hypothetical protein HGRIS_007567 [Hohenbuehelia grisea]|uniref:Chalcone isomerase domain-containing protein n=1 Tax=Hohenbuehelia grisea TaxID=104357 RepID=A0ABR3J5E9_9AGAR